ncbi:uncharacterized protein LOC102804694 isoform X1 [Saccoglossus kowalevskii]
MDASADASTVEEQSALAQGTDGDAETLEIPVIEGGDHGSDGAAALAMSNDYSLYVQEGAEPDFFSRKAKPLELHILQKHTIRCMSDNCIKFCRSSFFFFEKCCQPKFIK